MKRRSAIYFRNQQAIKIIRATPLFKIMQEPVKPPDTFIKVNWTTGKEA